MEGVMIDGNNILNVYDTIKGVREYCIKYQKPYLIECMTFRMRGHEEASGTKYVPPELFKIWELRDPVKNFEEYIKSIGIISEEGVQQIRNEFKEKIEDELAIGFNTRYYCADV
jgi:2-oxoisovalerate dehydrogenase E1 component